VLRVQRDVCIEISNDLEINSGQSLLPRPKGVYLRCEISLLPDGKVNDLDPVESSRTMSSNGARVVCSPVVYDHPLGRQYGLLRHRANRILDELTFIPSRRDQNVR